MKSSYKRPDLTSFKLWLCGVCAAGGGSVLFGFVFCLHFLLPASLFLLSFFLSHLKSDLELIYGFRFSPNTNWQDSKTITGNMAPNRSQTVLNTSSLFSFWFLNSQAQQVVTSLFTFYLDVLQIQIFLVLQLNHYVIIKLNALLNQPSLENGKK